MKVKTLIAMAASSLFAASLVYTAPVLADDNIGADQTQSGGADSATNLNGAQGDMPGMQGNQDATPPASNDNDAMGNDVTGSDPSQDASKPSDGGNTDKDQNTDDDY